MSRPAKAIIDLPALRANFDLAVKLAKPGKVVAVIKANAYAHGAVEVARALQAQAPAFAVACGEEAMLLREAGIKQPILLLEGPFSHSDLLLAAEQQCWCMIENPEQVKMLLATPLPGALKVWLKVDTGMHRLGLSVEQCRYYLPLLQQCHYVQPDIVLTSHFACADELDNDFTVLQLNRFAQLTDDFNLPTSLANSPALLGWPQAASDWSRVGLMLYGASPFEQAHPLADQLKPVMSLRSSIISLRQVPSGETVGYGGRWRAARPSLIATVAIGYADGYPRVAANGTPVWVRGQQAPLAGRVSMDMLGVDVTDVAGVTIGDEVELWGQHIAVNQVAAQAGTLSYDILASMPSRVPRIYCDAD